MIRPVTLMALGALACAALGLYLVADRVKERERVLAELEEQARRDRHAITVLRAEWAFLNEPQRLQRLAVSHLDLTLTDATRIGGWHDVPLAGGDLPPAPAPMPEKPDLNAPKVEALPASLVKTPPLPARRPVRRPDTNARIAARDAQPDVRAERPAEPRPAVDDASARGVLLRRVGAALALVAAGREAGQ